MCRIAGILNSSESNVSADQADAEKMISSLRHGGPDGQGIQSSQDGKATFSMALLSIVNRGNSQSGPYTNSDQNLMMTFNGEIYNYKELSEKYDIPLNEDATDAHLALALYEKKGIDFLNDLDGMFALGLYDQKQDKYFLARDRMGEKPLFYKQEKGKILFASEIKALQEITPAPFEMGEDFMALEASLAPDTTYEGVKKVPASSVLEIDAHSLKMEETEYWKLEDSRAPAQEDGDKPHLTAHKLLDENISRMRTDQASGLTLSGGLDSSILAMMIKPSVVFTVSYPGFEQYSEHKEAAEVAKKINAEHVIIRPDWKTFKKEVPNVIKQMDSPSFLGPCFSEYLIHQEAKKRGIRVMYSGIGPDEFLMGYARHILHYADAKDQLKDGSPLSEAYEPLRRMYEKNTHSGMSDAEKYAELTLRNKSSFFMRSRLVKMYKCGADAAKSMAHVDRHAVLETSLHGTDAMSSAHGIEVRSPFLSKDFVEFMYNLNTNEKYNGESKHVLRDLARHVGVPPVITEEKNKKGFSAPITQWLNGPLSHWFEKQVNQDSNFTDVDSKKDKTNASDRGAYGRETHLKLMNAFLKNDARTG